MNVLPPTSQVKHSHPNYVSSDIPRNVFRYIYVACWIKKNPFCFFIYVTFTIEVCANLVKMRSPDLGFSTISGFKNVRIIFCIDDNGFILKAKTHIGKHVWEIFKIIYSVRRNGFC